MTETLADRRIPAGDNFLSRDEVAAITPEILIARTTALKPLVAECAQSAEEQRRLDNEVWNALRKTGYFYTYVRKKHGGLQFDTGTYISATLPIAEACPSTGWPACFALEHNWFIAQMPEETQAEVWGKTPFTTAPSAAFPPARRQRWMAAIACRDGGCGAPWSCMPPGSCSRRSKSRPAARRSRGR